MKGGIIMEYMSTKEASNKWNISERRIRNLLLNNRIDGAIKLGHDWNIPINASKPIDKRTIKEINNDYMINLDDNFFNDVDELNNKLNKLRPLSKESLRSLKESIDLEMIFNSNAIEGNTLTLRETQIVLEGITVGGKTIKEHLEAINHEKAILYLDDLVKDKDVISERNIKDIHQLILKDIDSDNAGIYRKENVIIKGAKHIPPEYMQVPILMEKLILKYKSWDKYHPIVKAALLHGEFVKIHPFIDGNGRCARLLMNLSLMNSGYLPIIIEKERRLDYYNYLDKAHTTNDYTDFIEFIYKLELEMLGRYLLIV